MFDTSNITGPGFETPVYVTETASRAWACTVLARALRGRSWPVREIDLGQLLDACPDERASQLAALPTVRAAASLSELLDLSVAGLTSAQLATVEDVVRQWRAEADLLLAERHHGSFSDFIRAVTAAIVGGSEVAPPTEAAWYESWLRWTREAFELGATFLDALTRIVTCRRSLLAARPSQIARTLQRVAVGVDRVRRSLHPHAPPGLPHWEPRAGRLRSA